MVDPLTATAIGTGVANLGLGFYNSFSGGDEGLSRDDQRWMNDFSWKQSLRNEEFQNQLANHGIKMRVDDAVSAGLHPLVGAGINPASGGWSGPAFSGSASGGRPPIQNPGFNMGQNLSRAVNATSTLEEKQIRAIELERAKTQLQGDQIQNAIAAKQLSMMGMTPPMPSKYQTVSTPGGGTENVYSSDYSQAIMSDPIGMWANSFKKSFGGPDTGPFWNTVGNSALRLMHPWRKQ